MTGWNMPPGVSERDIPGNSPEDEICEDCERCNTCECHWTECPLGKFEEDCYD